MLAIRYFVREFGDIERFASVIERTGAAWIAAAAVFVSAAAYTWFARDRPLRWIE